MKTALEILRQTHEELSRPNPTDWKSSDSIMKDGTGEAMLKAMERYADQFRQPFVSGSLPIEEVALHAADDWFETAKFRSDVRADLKSYYEGFRDAMRFCRGNDR